MLEIWDGKSKSRQTDKYAAPNADDWNRVIKEVSNTQRVVIENNNVYSNLADEDILAGQPLILQSNSRILLADTNIQVEITGISIVDCEINEDCIYITQGRLTLEDWSNVISEEKLTPGESYFLSMQEKGKLTIIAPDSGGTVIVQVGRAQSAETLSIGIEMPIYLT